jgi:hypothetical protein
MTLDFNDMVHSKYTNTKNPKDAKLNEMYYQQQKEWLYVVPANVLLTKDA